MPSPGTWSRRAKRGVGVTTVHCHLCGGVIFRPATIQYRPPRASAQLAVSHDAPCRCSPPVVYEELPGLSSPTDSHVDITPQDLVAAVRVARERARELSGFLESQGHPQTRDSNALYLALVSIQKRLLTVDPAPHPVVRFVPELEQLTAQCKGKLAPMKPLLEAALRIARSALT